MLIKQSDKINFNDKKIAITFNFNNLLKFLIDLILFFFK